VKNRIKVLIGTALVLCIFGPETAVRAQSAVNEASGTEYREGLKLYGEGKYDAAALRFGKAFELDERNTAAVFAHGLALDKLGRYEDAALKFEGVLERDPGHEKALRMYPAVLARLGLNDRALAAWDRGIEVKPDLPFLRLGKARLLIALERPGEAVPLIGKALELGSREKGTFELLAYAHRALEQYDHALAAYDSALVRRPGDIDCMYLRAQTLSESGRLDEAFRAASDIIRRNGNHARARIIAGDCERLKGRYDEALGHYGIAAGNIGTRAYAEHFIKVIEQKLEEMEIEREWEEGQRKQGGD